MLRCSVMLNSWRPHGLQPTRFLCLWSGLPFPSPGIILIQGLNTGLLQCQEDSLLLSDLEANGAGTGLYWSYIVYVKGGGLYHDTEQVNETKNISQFFRLSFKNYNNIQNIWALVYMPGTVSNHFIYINSFNDRNNPMR